MMSEINGYVLNLPVLGYLIIQQNLTGVWSIFEK